VYDDSRNPATNVGCNAGQGAQLQVALRDANGQSIRGGGALLHSLDLSVAHVIPRGDYADVKCVAPGTATLELAAPEHITIPLTAR